MCQWNLNSIAINGFSKLPLLEASNANHMYDPIYLFEIYLYLSVPYEMILD